MTVTVPSALAAGVRLNGVRMLRSLGLDSPTPLVKQLPTLALFGAAVIMSVVVPSLEVTSVPGLAAACLLMIVVTAFAVLVTARPALKRLEILIPAADFVAIGVLRFATGESQSIFGSLAILPVVWVATMEGRRFIAFAALGALVSVVVPLLIAADVGSNPNELFRAAFNPVAFGAAAAVVNELARQARKQLRIVRVREEAAASELSQAAVVQRALLPKDGGSLAGYEVAGVCIPSKSVGGDFFDWYPIDGGIALTIGDVMGKGVGAGMIAATARAVVRSAARRDDPIIALERLATCLATELSEAATFVTLFHARVRAADGLVSYADAGHGLTLVVRADGTAERLSSLDFPLGALADDGWARLETVLGRGETIVSFSDGVLDLYDGTLTAVDEVAAIARSSRSARELVDAIASVARLEQNPDDVTIVALRRDA